jgi:hypothetical protein
MGTFKAIRIGLLLAGLAYGSTAMAQVPDAALTASLDAAIAANDTATVNAIILANQNNPVALAQIAQALLAAAVAAKTTNPTQAGLLAAMAVNTGALPGDSQVQALNIVGSSPSAMSLLTNPNAPNAGGSQFVSADSASKPIGLPTTGAQAAQNAAQTAENTSQTNGSRN